MNFYERERDLIVIPVTNVQAKFRVALPFLLEKTPTPYIGCLWWLPPISYFQLLLVFILILPGRVLATKENLFASIYRQCPFFPWYISNITYQRQQWYFYYSLVTQFSKCLFEACTLPSCPFDFPHPWKNTFRYISHPIVAEFDLRMQILLLPFSPQSSTNFFYIFFNSEAAMKTCPN